MICFLLIKIDLHSKDETCNFKIKQDMVIDNLKYSMFVNSNMESCITPLVISMEDLEKVENCPQAENTKLYNVIM